MGHWADAQSMYGVTPQAPSYGAAAPTQHMGTDDIANGWRALVDPHNPLVWLGGLALVTVGLGAFASSVRIGKATARISVGSGREGE